MIQKVIVKYNNKIVGYLIEMEDNKIAFQYDEEWIESGFSISPFSLPLTNKIYINQKQIFDGLYGVFQDSLPDGWGELLLRRMLLKNGLNYDKLNPLEKLTFLSRSGLGGLYYEPCKNIENTNEKYDLDVISKECEKILNNKNDNYDLDKIFNLGGSSGGARPKVHININNEEWIVKFPCYLDAKNAGEQEYKANMIAKKCGINVNDYDLFKSKICTGYFGAKRFDRKDNKRIHMVSLCALLETTHRIPNLDYYHLFQVTKNICVDKNDMYEVFRRMCFNVFYKNLDDHGKNFSFLYSEELKGYKLSPAYDLTSTPNKLEHEMTVNGNGNPNKKDMLALAQQFNLSLDICNKIIDEIQNIIKQENI